MTEHAGVYPSDPSQLGLVPGNTTINWQQDVGGNEWAGGVPTDPTIQVGWAYASAQLAHCDQNSGLPTFYNSGNSGNSGNT